MDEEPKKAEPVTVEIRPEVTMLSVLKHLNYKAWFAMAEFIDNSIQSFAANRAKLKELNGSNFKLVINISIDPSGPGKITITDNAAGISEHDFPRAFRAAHVPTDRTGLSEFGIGMKSAAGLLRIGLLELRLWESRLRELFLLIYVKLSKNRSKT